MPETTSREKVLAGNRTATVRKQYGKYAVYLVNRKWSDYATRFSDWCSTEQAAWDNAAKRMEGVSK